MFLLKEHVVFAFASYSISKLLLEMVLRYRVLPSSKFPVTLFFFFHIWVYTIKIICIKRYVMFTFATYYIISFLKFIYHLAYFLTSKELEHREIIVSISYDTFCKIYLKILCFSTVLLNHEQNKYTLCCAAHT